LRVLLQLASESMMRLSWVGCRVQGPVI
jgi:hypothetical protein